MLDTLWARLSMQIFSQIGERRKKRLFKGKATLKIRHKTQSVKNPIFDCILPLKSNFFNVLRFD